MSAQSENTASAADAGAPARRAIKVLVVDDSAMVRQLLRRGLAADAGIEVVGTARDAYDARDKIVQLRPDVLTLDVEMPKMDGVEFLRRLMPQYPLPVVMVSSLTERGKRIAMEALEAGAVGIVTKPKADVARGLEGMLSQLQRLVKEAAQADVSHWRQVRTTTIPPPARRSPLAESTDKVIAIGASTGGVEALRRVISNLPQAAPGVVIVQHMPAGFTSTFAQRLDELSAMAVKEAEHNDRVLPGRVLLAPGGMRHLRVVRSGGDYRVALEAGDKVCGHCPSVEVMMQSVAANVGANAIGAMLTGMGHDGADGLVAMRRAGARTLAQDEASSVVFGMPREAYERGGAEELVPLGGIAARLVALLNEVAG